MQNFPTNHKKLYSQPAHQSQRVNHHIYPITDNDQSQKIFLAKAPQLKSFYSEFMSYFDNHPAEVWSYKNFIHYASGNSCLPRNPAKTWNYAYKQSLDEIERRYGHTDEKGRKASRLKSSFKASTSIWQKPPHVGSAIWILARSILQGAYTPPWVSSGALVTGLFDTTGRLHTALGFLVAPGNYLIISTCLYVTYTL